MKEFENKVVVVTGASQGIGLQTVKEYAKNGAKVVMVAINKDGLEKSLDAIKDGKENVSYIVCDLSKPKEIKTMSEEVLRKYNRIDIVVCNVGAFSDKLPWNEIDDKTWHDCLSLNTLSAYYCIKYFGEYMIKNRINGNFVCTGSSTALHLKKGRLHYSVSKCAIHDMAKILAMDLAKYNIRVNVVSPGPTATELVQARIDDPRQVDAEKERLKKIPLGRYAKMVDIANAIMFLSSEKASFITGAILPVDGGYTIGETI